MKYKALFFDADGVLIKDKYLFSELLEREHGISKAKTLPFFTGVFKQCSLGQADLKEELLKVIVDWDWRGTVDELIDYWLSRGTEIDPEVADYISGLQKFGTRCFVATDQERYRGDFLEEILGGGKVVEKVFCSANFGCKKKTPEFWGRVFQTVDGVLKDQILFVDDDKENVQNVSMLGIESCLFVDLKSLKDFLSQS